MAKLTVNQKLGIVAGVAFLLTGLGGTGVWWAQGLVQEKIDSIAAMQVEVGAAQDKIRKIPDLEQDVIILRENLYEYVKILPEEADLNDFARVTNQFRSQSGVAITQYLPGKPTSAGKDSPFERYTYKFTLKATLWQFMQFMSFFEDYERFVQIKDFTLTSGASNDRTNIGAAGVIHSIDMTVETYVYRASAKSKDVAIANYASKVEKLREEIFEARQTIAKPGFKFEGERGRRDIFIDPREAAGSRPDGGVGPSPRDQRRIIERLHSKLDDAQAIFRRLQDKTITLFDRYTLERGLREQIAGLEREVEETTQKGLISHAPLKLSWSREVVEPLAALKKSLSATKDETQDRFLSANEMTELLTAMRDDLHDGDMRGAIERYDMVEERLRVDRGDPRYAIFTKIEGLYMRAKLAEEFAGLPLQISGVCVNDGGKSGIILNGTVYQEGEYVDNNLLVKAVGRDSIEFVYKGFTVVKTQ